MTLKKLQQRNPFRNHSTASLGRAGSAGAARGPAARRALARRAQVKPVSRSLNATAPKTTRHVRAGSSPERPGVHVPEASASAGCRHVRTRTRASVCHRGNPPCGNGPATLRELQPRKPNLVTFSPEALTRRVSTTREVRPLTHGLHFRMIFFSRKRKKTMSTQGLAYKAGREFRHRWGRRWWLWAEALAGSPEVGAPRTRGEGRRGRGRGGGRDPLTYHLGPHGHPPPPPPDAPPSEPRPPAHVGPWRVRRRRSRSLTASDWRRETSIRRGGARPSGEWRGEA